MSVKLVTGSHLQQAGKKSPAAVGEPGSSSFGHTVSVSQLVHPQTAIRGSEKPDPPKPCAQSLWDFPKTANAKETWTSVHSGMARRGILSPRWSTTRP